MDRPWFDASFGPVAAGIALVLLGYYVVGDPLLGVWLERRLRRDLPSDPGARVSFYRLCVGWLCGGAAVALFVVAIEPGLDLRGIGVTWPTLPDGLVGGLVIGGTVGITIGLAVSAVAARRGTPNTVPEAVAVLLPDTREERGWAAAVAVSAGVCEEVVFRGLFLALGIGWAGLPPIAAAAIVTVVFAFVHIYQGAVGVLTTGLLGAFFAAVALSTGSLLLVIVLHIAVDLRSLVFSAKPVPRT